MECNFIPFCQICFEKININSYLTCPRCDVEWCTNCITEWLKTSKFCTGCKKIIKIDNLKPNNGLNRAYKLWRQAKIKERIEVVPNLQDNQLPEVFKLKNRVMDPLLKN